MAALRATPVRVALSQIEAGVLHAAAVKADQIGGWSLGEQQALRRVLEKLASGMDEARIRDVERGVPLARGGAVM